ncbi:MAG: methyltransferase, partial [Acidimicrobiaceae bacterium]|nr:methyltransferase [Acidimicrobiaceae bacterium]
MDESRGPQDRPRCGHRYRSSRQPQRGRGPSPARHHHRAARLALPAPRPLAQVEPELLRRLDEAWEPARAAGAIGRSSLEALRRHSAGFILDGWRDTSGGDFVDCGAGAGLVGVLLALELPASRWTLVDASERRCDMAARAVVAAGLTARVVVEHSPMEDVAGRSEAREAFDGMVARLFGPASELAECGLPLLRMGGSLVVSVSAETRRQWEGMPLRARTGCELSGEWSTQNGSFVSITRVMPAPAG